MRLILPLAILCLLPTLSAHAGSTPAFTLRIGLDHTYRHATTLLLTSDRTFSISDAGSGKALAHGAPNISYKVTVSAKGTALARVDNLQDVLISQGSAALTLMPSDGGFVKIARLDSRPLGSKGLPWHSYRGFLTVRREADSTFRVIDTVSLESYLYGVIPAEIGTKIPMEAMKAQAVAARTYALKNRGKCLADGFDLDDTTRCEGYEGVDGETAGSNAAVDATRGQVLTYAGQLIDATYSTDSGGMTACDDSGDCPYLQAVRDCGDTDGRDYAADGRYHTWTQTFTPAKIAKLLARDPRTHVGQFVSLTIDGLDASGRIKTATVSGVDGTQKTVTGPQLRQILGYDVLRSTRVTLTLTPNGEYRFDGKGWGHGLGMSQDGAVAMAGSPYHKDYQEILKHYYVGTQLASDKNISQNIKQKQTARRGF